MPLPSLATPEDAAAWGYDLPADSATALLSRASVRIRRAAGFPITPTTVTDELDVECGAAQIITHPVIEVTDVQAVADDGTLTSFTGWRWDGERLRMPPDWPLPGPPARRVKATWRFGYTVTPDGITELTCQVATRLSLTPAGMDVGVRERKVDDYSETYAVEQLDVAGDLLPGEEKALRRELGARQAFVVATA